MGQTTAASESAPVAPDAPDASDAAEVAATGMQARMEQWKDMSMLLTEAITLMFSRAESLGVS